MDDLLIEGASVSSSIAGASMKRAPTRPQTAPNFDKTTPQESKAKKRIEIQPMRSLTSYKSEDSTLVPKMEELEIPKLPPRPKSQHSKSTTRSRANVPKSRQSSARRAVSQSFRGTLELDEPNSVPTRARTVSASILAVRAEAKALQPSSSSKSPPPKEAESYSSMDFVANTRVSFDFDEDVGAPVGMQMGDEMFDYLDTHEDSLLDRGVSFRDMDDSEALGDFASSFIEDIGEEGNDGGVHALLGDEDNRKYHEERRKGFDGLSEKDTAALRLGRLVMSTVLNQPEISAADSISRFFTDVWLSKSGSELSSADTMSMSLMSHIQKSVTEFDPGVNAGPLTTATAHKSIAAVACEALDALIMVFGKSNPVLTDIREALMPVLFMEDPPPTPRPLANPTPESARELFPLTGKAYISIPTFCEDTALVVEDLRAVERALESEKAEVARLQTERDDLKEKLKKSTEQADESYGKLMAVLREQNRLKGVFKEVKGKYVTLKSQHDVATKELDEEKVQHEKLKKEHSLLAVKEGKTMEKYYEAMKLKREADEAQAALQVDLKYFRTENGSLHDTVNALKEQLQTAKNINTKSSKRIQELESFKADQAALRQDTLKRIQIAVSHANSRFSMSSRVHALLRDPSVDVAHLLEVWNIDLLQRNNDLEVLNSPETIELKILEKVNAAKAVLNEELDRVQKALQHTIDEEKRERAHEAAKSKEKLGELHQSLFEMQIERNAFETSLKEMQLKHSALQVESASNKGVSRTLKVTLLERTQMMEEDNMYETHTRELRRWKEDSEQLVAKLQKENNELRMRVKKHDFEEAQAIETVNFLTLEHAEAKGQVGELKLEVANLTELLEEKSGPSKEEARLSAENDSLKKKLTRLEEAFNDYSSLQSSSLDNSKYWQMHDTRCMDYESEIGLYMRHAETTHNALKRNLLDRERELKTARDAADEANRVSREVTSASDHMIQSYEGQLMESEDSLALAALFAAKINADVEKPPLLAMESNVSIFDVMDDEDLSSVLEALAREKASHKNTKDKYKKLLSTQATKQNALLVQKQELEQQIEKLGSHEVPVEDLEKDKMRGEMETARMTLGDIESAALNRVVPEMTDISIDTADLPQAQVQPLESLDKSTNTDELASYHSPQQSPKASSSSRRASTASKKPSARRSSTAAPTKTRRDRVNSVRQTAEDMSSRKKSVTNIVASESSSGLSIEKTITDGTVETLSSFVQTSDPSEPAMDTSYPMSPKSAHAASADDVAVRQESSTEKYDNGDNFEEEFEGIDNVGRREEPSCQTETVEVSMPEKEGKEDISDNLEEEEEEEDLDNNKVEVGEQSGATPAMSRSHSRANSVEHSLDLRSEMDADMESLEGGELDGELLQPSVSQVSVDTRETSLTEGVYPPERKLSSASEPVKKSVTTPFSFNEPDQQQTSVGLTSEAAKVPREFKFDSSISTESSSNYFFDILERRERRNLFENSRLRMILREAAGLVDRLENKLLNLSSESLKESVNATSRGSRVIDDMRADIVDSKWVFSLKPEHILQDSVLKDAILIGGNMRSVQGLDEDLTSLKHCNQVFNDPHASGGLSKMKREVKEKREDSNRRGHATSATTGKTGWEAVLYRSDGTVDTNMSLFGWDKSEKIEIYKTIVAALRTEIDEKTKAYSEEIGHLKDVIDALQKDAMDKNHRIEELTSQVESIKRSTVNTGEYEQMVAAVQDVTALLRNLTSESLSMVKGGPSSATGVAEMPSMPQEKSGRRNGVGAPSKTELYGNPALLWHKVASKKPRRVTMNKRSTTDTQQWQPPPDNSSLREPLYGEIPGGPSITGNSVTEVFHRPGMFGGSMTDSLRDESLASAAKFVPNASVGDASADNTFTEGEKDSERTGRPSEPHPLLRELSIACEGITERVLLPSSIRIQKPLVSRQQQSGLEIGEKCFQSQVTDMGPMGGATVSPLSLSEDILHYSETLNQQINVHMKAIKQLELRQNSLFDHNMRSLSAEAEKYYAEAVKIGETSDNLQKWAGVFAEGSASPVVLGLLHRSHPDELAKHRWLAGGVESSPQNRDDLPVIEKRSLGNQTAVARPMSAHPLLRSESTPVVGDNEPPSNFKFLPDFRNTTVHRHHPGMEKRKSKKYYRR